MFKSSIPCLLACAMAGSMCALDLVEPDLTIADLRLGIGVAPGPKTYKTTIEDPASTNTTGEIATDGAGAVQVSLGFERGNLYPVGFIWGSEFQVVSGTQQVDGITSEGVTLSKAQLEQQLGQKVPDLKYATYGLTVNSGLGVAINHDMHVELVGLLGLGGSTSDIYDSNGSGKLVTKAATGYYLSAGVRGGVYYALSSVVLGAVVEYTSVHMRNTASASNALDQKANADWSGVGARLELGYRF